MSTEIVTAMLLQNLVENTNTELQITENYSLREKCPNTKSLLVRIFFGPEITLYLDIFHAMIHKIYSLSV